METREERMVRNETTFRAANEDLRQTWDDYSIGPDEQALFVCECGDPRCTRVMRLTLDEYERIRADANTFAVLPGHDDASTEQIVGNGRVVDRNDRFAIVEKREEYRGATEASDPRG